MDLNDQLKPGGSIPEKGKKITLRVTKVEDLNRDVIKVCLYDGRSLYPLLESLWPLLLFGWFIVVMSSLLKAYSFLSVQLHAQWQNFSKF